MASYKGSAPERRKTPVAEAEASSSGSEVPTRLRRRDKVIVWATVGCALVVPWPVAIVTRSYLATSLALLVPVAVGAKLLTRSGWRVPVDRHPR
jgi:hypothetical protein